MAGKESLWLMVGGSGIVNFGQIDIVRTMSNQKRTVPVYMHVHVLCILCVHAVFVSVTGTMCNNGHACMVRSVLHIGHKYSNYAVPFTRIFLL